MTERIYGTCADKPNSVVPCYRNRRPFIWAVYPKRFDRTSLFCRKRQTLFLLNLAADRVYPRRALLRCVVSSYLLPHRQIHRRGGRVFTLTPNRWGGMVFCDTVPRLITGAAFRGCLVLCSSDFPPPPVKERAIPWRRYR